MYTLVLTLVIFLGAVLLLTGIAILSGRVLKGSCGGVAGSACVCSDEGQPRGTCEEDPPSDLIQIDVGISAGRN